MLTMKTCILFFMLLTFSSIDSLILPIQFSIASYRCNERSKLKSINCVHNGVVPYTMVTFGPANDPQIRHTVRFLLDTGSAITWVATSNTQLKDANGSQKRRWESTFVPEIPALNYTPDSRDRTLIEENSGYADGARAHIEAYRNHKLEFYKSNGETLEVAMDLYFATQYFIDHVNIPLSFLGTLALQLETVAEVNDFDNLFLYKFLQSYPPNKYEAMMSFDINWHEATQQPSCFGLGESLPSKSNLLGPSIDLESFSDQWSITVMHMKLEYPNGNRIIIEPDIPYAKKDTTVYLNSVGTRRLIGVIDSGSTNVDLSDQFVQQLGFEEERPFRRGHRFNCSIYSEEIPKIVIGFENRNGQTINITIERNKLFSGSSNQRNVCSALLGSNDRKYGFVTLGLPFFASVYMEMRWKDTRNISVADWAQQMTFDATVKLTQK